MYTITNLKQMSVQIPNQNIILKAYERAWLGIGESTRKKLDRLSSKQLKIFNTYLLN